MERDARVRAERRAEQEGNRWLALAQQLGEFRQRVAMLEAPKEDPASQSQSQSPNLIRHRPLTMQSRVHRSCAVSSAAARRSSNGAAASHALAPPFGARAPSAKDRAGRLWITRKGLPCNEVPWVWRSRPVPCHEVP